MSYLKNHKLLLLIIGVLLVSNFGLLYFNTFRNPKPASRLSEKEMREKAKERVIKEVGLTAEQAVVYDSLRNQQFKKMRPLFEELNKSKEEFFSLVYQDHVPDSVFQAYAARIGEKQMAVDVNTYLYFQSIKSICTEEQKSKMDSFIQQIVKRIVSGGRRGGGPDKKEKK
jgi:hypothetical protein